MWGPLTSGAWWCWRNISSPPTCCQKVLDQRGERKCVPGCALHPGWVLTWGWVHELLWVVAEQSILDVATAHATGPWREREMDTRAGLRAACWEMLGPLHSSGSDERCRAWPGPCQRCAFWAGLWCHPALEEALHVLGMLTSSPSWRHDCCLQSSQPGRTWWAAHARGVHHQVLSPHSVGVLALVQLHTPELL